MQTDDSLALAFNALAHPRWARLFRLLVETPEIGGSFSSLMAATGYRKAPLAHHLEVMERGGLIRRKRIGNAMTCMLTPAPLVAAMTRTDGLVAQAVGPARRVA